MQNLPKFRMNSMTLVSALLASTAMLSGCFQNLSGTESTSIFRSTTGNFTDTGGTATNGGFDGSNLSISTSTGGLVGSYISPSTSQLGIMVNLTVPITAYLGESVLQDLLNRVDTEEAVRNINVEVSVVEFGMKVKFPFSKIAYNNQKKLRNVMNIRPGQTGVDFVTGYAPDRAPVVQLSNGNIFTYGGVSSVTGTEGAIERITLFFRDTLTGGIGFFPSVLAQPSFGVGEPNSGDPQEDAILIPLTTELGKIYLRSYSSPPNYTDGARIGTGMQETGTSPSKYFLAVHFDHTRLRSSEPAGYGSGYGVTRVYGERDYFAAAIKRVYVNIAVSSGTPTVYSRLLCSKEYNDVVDTWDDPNNVGKTARTASPLACDCDPIDKDVGFTATVFDPCAASTYPTGSNIGATNKTENKLDWLIAAIKSVVVLDSACTTLSPPATNGTCEPVLDPSTGKMMRKNPRSGVLSISTTTVNGVTISPL